ncbi:unnamed protein product [Musa hybrid cultivar]
MIKAHSLFVHSGTKRPGALMLHLLEFENQSSFLLALLACLLTFCNLACELLTITIQELDKETQSKDASLIEFENQV